MKSDSENFPVGSRVVIRDAEWRITEVDMTPHAGARLKCIGISELVRGKSAIFFEKYEESIQLLKPKETRLVEDFSPGFQKSKLYLESLLRTAPKTDPNKIFLANKAAMDAMPYQFNPALQALKQPRARILIADAVGIGKTLEAGILTSELIARGRGKRILVLATKAMLSQFQQEFWNRFSIPLVRLDSTGIQRVRSKIPANHNPFLYFDRSIISIDTLKQDIEYRSYLEKAYWDIIIIDEAHNVAQRNNKSQRAKLAQLLANRSDTMIMLTATPHDGKPESFASLLNILDPTAIANPSDYQLSDFSDKGLVVRRFKSDVHSQVQQEFPDRAIKMVTITANEKEQAVFNRLSSISFKTLDNKNSKGRQLFSTTLTKAFFSSPAACSSVIKNRIANLQKRKNEEAAQNDIDELIALNELVQKVTPDHFSKLGKLSEMLSTPNVGGYWDKSVPDDRLVIFTESIETLDFLQKELPSRANLSDKELVTLKGSFSDDEIADTVNCFNRGDSPARVLLCSDVASEGINLHHFAHRLIHFDIPWSLMTFQQRNGRIDRYGQTKQPLIWYLQTVGKDEKSIGDVHILEKLTEKDNQAQHNLDDPAEFAGTQEEQEERTAAEMEGHAEVEDFFSIFEEKENDEKKGTAIAPVLSEEEFKEALFKQKHIYKSDMDFAQSVLRYMNKDGKYDRSQLDLYEHRILISLIPELRARIKYLPSEVIPEDGRFDLTDDVRSVQEEMKRVRVSGEGWPQQTLLWSLHPVMQGLEDYMLNAFGRHTAPVLRLQGIPKGERWALLQGGFPNRRGFFPIHEWVVIQEKDGNFLKKSIDELINSLQLDKELSNSSPVRDENSQIDCTQEFSKFVNCAVEMASTTLKEKKKIFDQSATVHLERKLRELKQLKMKHEEHLKQMFDLKDNDELQNNALKLMRKRKEDSNREQINRHFEDAESYIKNAVNTENEAYLQLVAIFSGLDA